MNCANIIDNVNKRYVVDVWKGNQFGQNKGYDGR